jgi:hypothetical protein
LWAITRLRQRWASAPIDPTPSRARDSIGLSREVTTESAKGHAGKRKPVLRSFGETQKLKTPMNGHALRSYGEAHIDIYQEGTASNTDPEVTPPSGSSSEGQKQPHENFCPSPETQIGDDPRIVSLKNWGRALSGRFGPNPPSSLTNRAICANSPLMTWQPNRGPHGQRYPAPEILSETQRSH